MAIKLIVGLRNPKEQYFLTRHNAGEWFLFDLAKKYNANFKAFKKLHGELASLEIDNFACKAFLPLTYMNHSGLAVKTVVNFLQIKINELLIVHDDLDLAPGRVKFKTGGGHGGHNGLRDIINQLKTADFHRLRIGIGHPQHRDLVVDYVLTKPTHEEKQLILLAIKRSIAEIATILSGDSAASMNLLNN